MNAVDSPLAFSFEADAKSFEGMIGLPPDSVETRISDHVAFISDVSAILWKMRADAKMIWPTAVTDQAGNPIGPGAVLH